MKKIILGFLCLMFASILSAKQINVELAELIASKHINTKVKQQNTRSKLLTLVHIEQNNDKLKNITKNYYYVFNIGNQNGFIIISADDINVPIIGYSTEGSYNPNDLPDNFKAWMKNIVNGMERALDEDFSDPHTYKIWNKYISDEITLTTRDASSRLAPLIKTKWNQNKPYNILIPITSSNGTNIYYPYTGCVATAMAQIMKFHNHPVKGTTTIPSYNSGSYPIPEIQSENLVYDWDNMLNIYYDNETETEKNAVAKLMFHCGVASRMEYSFSGSGTDSRIAARAFREYFDYISADYQMRGSNNAENWGKRLKQNLDKGYPLLYRGDENGYNGHAFVCDGYDEDNLFHFNWGWSGSQNGYYSLDAPLYYKDDQAAIFNIIPRSSGKLGILAFKNQSYTPTDIQCLSAEENSTIHVNIENIGEHDFRGRLVLALTDKDNNIQYNLSENQDISLAIKPKQHMLYDYNFTLPKDVIPGDYYLRMMYKYTGNYPWQPVNKGIEPYLIKVIVKNKNISGIISNYNTSNNISVYPNPAKEELYVSGIKEPCSIKIYNITSFMVLKKEISEHESIPLKKLTPGIYIARIVSQSGKSTNIKFLKK